MRGFSRRFAFAFLFFFAGTAGAWAQASGSLSGTVLDPSGAVIPNAKVTISNPVSGFTRESQTTSTGAYQFSNIPFNSYHVAVQAVGFNSLAGDVAIRATVPILKSWTLVVAAASQTVTVTADNEDLLQNTSLQSTQMDTKLLEKIPMEGISSGLSTAITLGTPGVVADSNGSFHPQGEHSDTSFSVDGQPITDQQSRNFSNQLSMGAIQSVEVINGIAPAEYGDKASLVVKTVTKSGIGMGRPHGSIGFNYGSFGTTSIDGTLGFGTSMYGSFLAVDGSNSGRFLDSPEFQPLHDHGNVENIFERLDYQPEQADSFHLNLGVARSWAQTPNQYDQEANGQDQRQEIKSWNVSPTYTHLFTPTTLLNVNLWARQDQVHYMPSKNPFADTPATLADSRRLTNMGFKTDISYVKGIQNLKGGFIYNNTPLKEHFGIGITSATYNAPCLDANGNPISDPAVVLPCSGEGEQINPGYQPGQAQYDLTRGGKVGFFGGTTDIKEETLYLQDELHLKQWTASLGVRADNYNGISSRSMVAPRVGLSYDMQKTGTILRAGYGKFFLTPYNENLIVSSYTGLGGLAGNVGAYGQYPLKAAARNQFGGGLQQALGRRFAVTADYFWKFTDRDFDFDVLLNSPLAFPIQWRKSKIDGYAVRVSMAQTKGFTAYAVLGHTRARFFGPEIGGIIFNDPNTPTSGAPFRIDHDQNFQQTTHFQWQPKPTGPWYGFNWSYESGAVAGLAPYATDTTTPVSLTYLTPDQQQQAALACGGVKATLTHPLTSCAPNLLTSTLLQIPAPGTQNPDKNPARVAPRHLFDMSAGYDNVFHSDKYKTNFSVTAVNIANQYSLYNFLSTFSGTHYVSPRTVTGQISFVF